jgi:O-antigen ligase
MSLPVGTLTRALVIASMLLAVAAGLRPLAAQPAVLISLTGVFLGAAVGARLRFGITASVILLFAYISYGVVRLIGGAALAAMPYWLAAFAGLVVGGVSWTRWQAGDGWRVPLAWWAVTVAVAWPFVAARELNYSLAPSLAAGPVITTALIQMSVALWMDRLLASRRRLRELRAEPLTVSHWAAPLLVSALVTGGAALYQHFVNLSWLSGEPWISLQRSPGMMGDANPMGVATALWAPLAWAMLAAGGLAGALIGAPLAAGLWLAAWFSGARTTIILIAAGITGIALMWAVARGIPRRLVALTVVVAALAMVVVAGIAASQAPAGTPVARLVAALPKGAPHLIAYELFWRRDGYGLAAVEALNEHPFTGVGIGRFASQAPVYYQRIAGTAIPPDNAQNLWRQTLAEQGLFGFLPILWLTMLTLRALVSGPAGGEELILRLMLAGMGAALLFGYPVQDAAIAVTLGTLVAAVGRARADGL